MMTASAPASVVPRAARLVEQDHRARRRAGHERAMKIADRHEADIEGMKAVDVLHRPIASSTRDESIALGQRQLHENAVDCGIGVEPIDERQQFGFAGRGCKICCSEWKPQVSAALPLARHRPGLPDLADQHGREPGLYAGAASARVSGAARRSRRRIALPSRTNAWSSVVLHGIAAHAPSGGAIDEARLVARARARPRTRIDGFSKRSPSKPSGSL